MLLFSTQTPEHLFHIICYDVAIIALFLITIFSPFQTICICFQTILVLFHSLAMSVLAYSHIIYLIRLTIELFYRSIDI